MPTSFSRVMNEEDLAEVRKQYLAALDALEEDEATAGSEQAEDNQQDAKEDTAGEDEAAGKEGN